MIIEINFKSDKGLLLQQDILADGEGFVREFHPPFVVDNIEVGGYQFGLMFNMLPKGERAMGVRTTSSENTVALYDSVTGYPINIPVFDSSEDAGDFLDWVDDNEYRDLRTYSNAKLEEIYNKWAGSK